MRQLILAGLVLSTVACAKGSAPVASSEGVPAETLSLPDLSGKTVSLSDYKGQVVLLDFWATWCGPCVEELPDLIEAYKAFRGDGFTVLGVAVEASGAKEVRDFVAAHQVPYPVLIAADRPQGYRVRALPTAYLIDRRGRLRQRYLGSKDPVELRKDIEILLKEKA